MRKKRCTLKNGNSKNIINGVVKQNKCLDIKKLYLRNAPKRPGYRPIPGVSVYPQNFKSPRIIKEGTYKDKALDICHDSISEEQSSCRCGDVITCPGSQEFRCNNSDKSDHVEENFISSCKPVDFRGLRGLLWSKIDVKKVEMFEKRFTEPNASGTIPQDLNENFGAPIFLSKNNNNNNNKLERKISNSNENKDIDLASVIELWNDCNNRLIELEPEYTINRDLQNSIKAELDHGIRLLEAQLRKLAMAERQLIHLQLNQLSSQVGTPKYNAVHRMLHDNNKKVLKYDISNISWFMGLNALDIGNYCHKIADLEGKFMFNSQFNQASIYEELESENEDLNKNWNINYDNKLDRYGKELLSRHLGRRLAEKESELLLQRNTLTKLSKLTELLQYSPLANFPCTKGNRYIFLNPVDIGNTCIVWNAFDFVDFIPCVLKLYKVNFEVNMDLLSKSIFAKSLCINSNSYKLKSLLEEGMNFLRLIKYIYNRGIQSFRSRITLPKTCLYTKQKFSNLSSSIKSDFILKNKFVQNAIASISLCSNIFEWHIPLSSASIIVESHPYIEYYDIRSYVSSIGVMDEYTALMYIRSLIRLLHLISLDEMESDQSLEFQGTFNIKHCILPIKASHIYVKKEECCISIGPLDSILLISSTNEQMIGDLDTDFSQLRAECLQYNKCYPQDLFLSESLLEYHNGENIVYYLPNEIIMLNKRNLNIGENFDSLPTSTNVPPILFSQMYTNEQIHIYMTGVLLYYCLTGNYYNRNIKEILDLSNVSQDTKDLLLAMLDSNRFRKTSPTFDTILNTPLLSPENLVGTCGVQLCNNRIYY
ncbi:hypothetical protein cand_019000 [Cryptosporidium andersoni]|uniref:Protein kinase domain-containing protein n=1 Tax=Cryptosporidium andersoni TaxID=117008 RepID=A0A1J4MDW3_9CRYT|nr:hypothetical protein cand_019000 [Cryptosporidium andersoni]